jgi:DNA invertase Pin-like site-specific DNA recombinase
MKTAVYARVSTDGQELENQLRELKEYCPEPSTIYTEVESGAKPGRAVLNDILADAHRHRFDRLVVVRMDRLTRRGIGALMDILKQLNASGVTVVSLREPFLSTDGPARDLLLAVFAWVAELERKQISERTKAGLARRRALGVKLGRPKKTPPQSTPDGTGDHEKRDVSGVVN